MGLFMCVEGGGWVEGGGGEGDGKGGWPGGGRGSVNEFGEYLDVSV